MNIPSLPDATKAVEQGDKTITNQTKTASDRPLAWAAVIGVIAVVGVIVVLLVLLIKSETSKAILQGQKDALDTMYSNRIEATRLFYDMKYERLLDENKQLYYKIGGMDATKK